jgi:hypothetical protein
MGYDHIPQAYAKPINAFYQETFNPWLNLHRPCLFATSITNDKGKTVKRYKPEGCEDAARTFGPAGGHWAWSPSSQGITLAALQAQAKSQTDLAAAQAMQRAKRELFAGFVKPKRRA